MGEKYNCKVEGCNRKYHLKGYCRLHLRAYETYGDPYKTTVPRRSRRKKIAFEIDDNGCFICTSHAGDPFGYRKITINGKSKSMHRFIYEEMFGPIPEGLVVRHKCDNPRCINPEHLELGTIADNNRDIWERGRGNVPHRAFTGEQVMEILRRIKNGEKQTDLAKEYGVSLSTINHIKTGRNYKRLLETKGE